MSGKELKPTLGTGVPKTRKRNITLKHDPEAFRNRVIEVLERCAGELKASISGLDVDDLDYSRYGEVFAEVSIAGNIVEPGGSLRGQPTQFSVFQAEDRAGVMARVELLHQLMRRKPFLRARYDMVVEKLLVFLPSFQEASRKNFAAAVGIMMHGNMITPTILTKIDMEANIEGGFALEFIIAVMESFLRENNNDVEKMMHVLRGASIDTGTIVNWMPKKIRSAEALSDHFREKGLEKLVGQNERRIRLVVVTQLKEGVTERVEKKTPFKDIAKWIEDFAQEHSVGESERVGATWDGIIGSIDLSRKTQQNRYALLQALQDNAKLLLLVCRTGMDEFELLMKVQSFISADMELLKIAVFRDIVNLLYQADVFSEDTVLRWYRRGTTLNKGSAASSNIIREQMVSFIKWLETAEEESDDE